MILSASVYEHGITFVRRCFMIQLPPWKIRKKARIKRLYKFLWDLEGVCMGQMSHFPLSTRQDRGVFLVSIEVVRTSTWGLLVPVYKLQLHAPSMSFPLRVFSVFLPHRACSIISPFPQLNSHFTFIDLSEQYLLCSKRKRNLPFSGSDMLF